MSLLASPCEMMHTESGATRLNAGDAFMSLEKIGRYEVLSELGRKGMAIVYLTRDPRMKRWQRSKSCRASLLSTMWG